MIARHEVAKLSFRAGVVLATVWLIAVGICLAAGYLEGVAWAMLMAPVAGVFMLLAMLLTAFEE
jgi:hypothetical protein